MSRRADLDGAAHLVLVPGVRHLNEATAVFEAMLDGWERQQKSRYLQPCTIGPRLRGFRQVIQRSGPGSRR